MARDVSGSIRNFRRGSSGEARREKTNELSLEVRVEVVGTSDGGEAVTVAEKTRGRWVSDDRNMSFEGSEWVAYEWKKGEIERKRERETQRRKERRGMWEGMMPTRW